MSGQVRARFSDEAWTRAVEVLAGEVGNTTIAESLLSDVLKALGVNAWPTDADAQREYERGNEQEQRSIDWEREQAWEPEDQPLR